MRINRKGWKPIDNQYELNEWAEKMQLFHLPRWEELPDFDLYLDQMLNLLDRYLYVFKMNEKENLVTASMVHNYVKLGMIPKPLKKRYTRKHLAYLIAITILKQVLTIPEIKKGIMYQASISGIRGAYDLFCLEQEYALKITTSHLLENQPKEFQNAHSEDSILMVRNATIAAASKLIIKKTLSIIP